jgi:hypothetical protein
VAYATRTEITWKELNPAEGVYNWAKLDDQIDLASKDNKKFSFRVYTMAGEEYGGHQIPDWVLEKGAVILSSGEPDYSNCAYQEQWGNFVDQLIRRYDANPSIAYIDISGYGNFNEWSWSDFQTEWDEVWDEDYASGAANRSSFIYLDSQARRRLADMFIGGSYTSHQCRDENGVIEEVNYSYTGAQKTQLVMPYAGINQSTEYVFTMRKDVGFRFDCLGRLDTELPEEISEIWTTAPVVYEFCGPGDFDVATANEFIRLTHPSLIHNNDYSSDFASLQQLMFPVGYRLFLKKAEANYSVNHGETLSLDMIWQNLGTAPVYPKMGLDYRLRVSLIDPATKTMVLDFPTQVDVSSWLPADPLGSSAPEYATNVKLIIPESVQSGYYILAVSITDDRTGIPIQLPVIGDYIDGRLNLFEVHIK